MSKATVKIQHIGNGWRKILESDAVCKVTQEAADDIADTAGEGFERGKMRKMGYGGGRWGCYVTAETYEARCDEAENGVLTRAAHSTPGVSVVDG